MNPLPTALDAGVGTLLPAEPPAPLMDGPSEGVSDGVNDGMAEGVMDGKADSSPADPPLVGGAIGASLPVEMTVTSGVGRRVGTVPGPTVTGVAVIGATGEGMAGGAVTPVGVLPEMVKLRDLPQNPYLESLAIAVMVSVPSGNTTEPTDRLNGCSVGWGFSISRFPKSTEVPLGKTDRISTRLQKCSVVVVSYRESMEGKITQPSAASSVASRAMTSQQLY